MSVDPSEIAPEDEDEFEERSQELIEGAKEQKEELEAKQNEALQQIKEGEEFEEYEDVTLGELDLTVKAWLPGDVEGTITRANKLADSEDVEAVRQSMETMLHALAEMTEEEAYDMRFWSEYYSEYGPEGLIVAVETILEPATEGIEERKEGVESFRSS